MKIGVVMASYLGEYSGCASNRIAKFLRAVNSFIEQDYENKILIIVSDGCEDTNSIYDSNIVAYLAHNIYLIKSDKMPVFSGEIRNKGIKFLRDSWCDIICYLDSDDYLESSHLSSIAHNFDKEEWIYFNDTLKTGSTRTSHLANSQIGTSNIAHNANINVLWGDGYGHDWWFITKLMEFPYKKVDINSYVVCHIPSCFDL